MIRKVLLMMLVLNLIAGSSSHSVNIRKDPNTNQMLTRWETTPPLKKGDHLQYTLKNGSKGKIDFKEISNGNLNGLNGSSLPLDQIASLERKEVSKGKTAAAVGAGVGVTAIIITIVIAVGIGSLLVAAA